ncbi:MAG: hypothetical protein JKX68_06310 [Flavobacteriales bacterium]|nr:hypothetical protein [Flavobacteriales bacterium]
MKKIAFILLIVLLPLIGSSQNFGAGVSALYNIQSESFGAGARVSIFPNRTISYVPQASYYFIGPVSEYTIGLSIELKVLRLNTFTFYLLGHGGYNNWQNATSSGLEGATPTNWNLEGGVGVTTNKCLRPFLEYRYNIKFQETHLQLGLLYIFGCKGDRMGYRNAKKVRKSVVCPAYK